MTAVEANSLMMDKSENYPRRYWKEKTGIRSAPVLIPISSDYRIISRDGSLHTSRQRFLTSGQVTKAANEFGLVEGITGSF